MSLPQPQQSVSKATTAAKDIPPPPVAAARRGRPWVEEHRPAKLADVVAHEEILGTIRRLMSNNSLPHLLFYGPAGTGKTSTIQAVYRELYGSSIKSNVLELNASDDRGIDVVRDTIKNFASTGQLNFGFMKPAAAAAAPASADGTGAAPASADGAAPAQQFPRPQFKMVILDEADQMSGEAQAALRRVIEQFTKNVRFCILCNHVNKILPAVQSRCTRFRFAPVKLKQMMPRLETICTAEKADFSPKGLEAAFKLSGGDMRRCVNLLQASFLATGAIHEENVYRAAGYPTPEKVKQLFGLMFSQDFVSAHTQMMAILRSEGLSVVDLIKELHPLLQKIDLPEDCKCHCYKELAEIEYNLSAGSSEPIAASAVLATMQLVKEKVTKKQ